MLIARCKGKSMKTTTELLDILKMKNNYQEFFDEVDFSNVTLSEYLHKLIKTKSLRKTEVISQSGLERSYAYQIFAGRKVPSRDKLILLAFGMRLNFEEVQGLLKVNGYAQLYSKNRRDNIIIFALYKGQSILELNENLLALGEAIIA